MKKFGKRFLTMTLAVLMAASVGVSGSFAAEESGFCQKTKGCPLGQDHEGVCEAAQSIEAEQSNEMEPGGGLKRNETARRN